MNITRITQLRFSARFFAGLTILSLILSAFPASFFVAQAQQPDNKIDICHWSQGEQTFSLLNVAKSSIGNAHGAQGSNDGDIIPPHDDYPGQNWDANGQAIYNNGCVLESTPTASLRIVKEVLGGNVLPSAWTMSATASGNEYDFQDSGDSTTFHTVAAGIVYAMSESDVPNYTLTDISCVGSTASQDGGLGWNDIRLAEGDQVTCTFTNTYDGYTPVYGCMDDGATNYNPDATQQGEVECEYGPIDPPPQQCVNLLINGSFEEPVVTETSLWQKFVNVAGWIIQKVTDSTPTTLELHRNWSSNEAADGLQYAELDGDHSTKVSQPVATLPGGEYKLSWEFAPRHAITADQNVLSVLLNGVPVATSGPATGAADLAAADWTYGSHTFVASATSTVVTFADAGPSNSFGTYLDDAQLCLVKAPEPEPEICEDASLIGAVTVDEVDQKKRRDGSAITDPNRTDPTEALGTNNWVPGTGTDFFSLGFGGSITLEFDRYVIDVAGTDLKIYEGTNGSYPEEIAKIEVSQNGVDFEEAGTASSNNPSRITDIDFASTSFAWIKFVRVTDMSNLAIHSNDADGFDLDAVVATEVTCKQPVEPEVPKVLPQCSQFFTDGIVITQEQVLLSHDAGGAFIGPQTVNIPAGYYDVNALSFDFHTDNLWDNLPFEQWYVNGVSGSTTVFASESTDDLPQGQNTIMTQLDRAAYFPNGLDALQWVHSAYPNGEYHSIHPLCLQFIPVEPPVEQCTVVSSPKTVVVETNEFAVPTYTHNNWIASTTMPGAEWIWETYYSEDSGDVDNNITYTFVETFNVATPTTAVLDIAADNAYIVYINDVLVLDRSLPIYDNNFQAHTYKKDLDVSSFIVNGENELKVVATNKGVANSNSRNNPAGVLFKLTMEVVEGELCEITTDVIDTSRTIYGYKYEGEYEGNTTPVPNWVINLYNVITDELVMSTTTDANGYYYFTVGEGEWEVREGIQEGWYQVGVQTDEDYEYTDGDDEYCYFEFGKLKPKSLYLSSTETLVELEAPDMQEGYECSFFNLQEKERTMTLTGTKYVVEAESDVPRAGWTIYAYNLETEETLSTTTDEFGNYSFTVPVGDWEVYEAIPEGWEQEAVYENGWLVEDEGQAPYSCYFYESYEYEGRGDVSEVSVYDYEYETEYNCDFYNIELDGDVPTVTEDRGRNNSSSGTRTARASAQPLVAGASVSVCPFLNDYMQIGIENNPFEVTKLQLFLNIFVAPTLITGIFDALTDTNVKTFQETHRAEILEPWFEKGIVPHNEPTGFVYKLTRWKINDIICPGYEPYPSFDGESLNENIDLD